MAKNLLCSTAFIVKSKGERERESKESANEGKPLGRPQPADVVIHKPISGHVPCDIIQACHVLHIYYALIVIVHIKSEREKIIFSNFIVLYCAGNSLENCTRCESE